MPTNNRSNVLAKLLDIFKAVPQSQLDDLHDALNFDAKPGADVFNSLAHRNPDEAQNPTGSTQAASGSGAVRMVGEYADPAGQSALVEQYQQMAAELDTVRNRLADVEKSNRAMATLLLTIAKGDDEAVEEEQGNGADKEDQDKEDGTVKSITLADMMLTVAGQVREQKKALARVNAARRPPDMTGFAAVQKSDALAVEPEFDINAANKQATLAMRRQMVAAGHWPESVLGPLL